MANLVPLHLDKDTGEFVATRNPATGGGGPSVPGTGALGYLHIQNIASDVWTINHANATDLLLTQVFTTGGELLIPDSITLININTVEVTFSVAITGRAHLIFFTT